MTSAGVAVSADAGAARDPGPDSGAHPEPADRGQRSESAAGVGDTEFLDAAVAAARTGDEVAFAQVYRLVHPRLLRYLRVLVGDDAEDIASETWANVCRDLSSFRGEGEQFRRWIATIGRNRAIDHLRARGRRPSDPVPPERLIHLAGSVDTEGMALDSISTGDAVALIASLPPDQAEAVMLRAVLGLDATAAGHVLGKRAGAVRTAAHRGLRTLRRRLETDVAR